MKKRKRPAYADLGDHAEDDRIGIIGAHVVNKRKTVAFVVDSLPGKADRYLRKLTARFPSITKWERFDGPVKGTTTIKVYPPGQDD